MIAPGAITAQLQARVFSVAQEVLASFPNPLAPDEPGKITTVIEEMISTGDWNNTRSLACFAMFDPINALWDWKRQETMTNVSGSVHTPSEGYLFDGLADHINTNFLASSELLLDDLLISVYCYENFSASSFRMLFGVTDDSSNALLIDQNVGGDSLIYQVNTTTNSVHPTVTGAFLDGTRYSIGRNDAVNNELYIAGIEVDSEADASVGLPDLDIYVGARNNNGTPNLLLNASVSYFHAMISPDIVAINNELNTLENLFIV